MPIHHQDHRAVRYAHSDSGKLDVRLDVFEPDDHPCRSTTILTLETGIGQFQAHINSDDLADLVKMFRKAHRAHQRKVQG